MNPRIMVTALAASLGLALTACGSAAAHHSAGGPPKQAKTASELTLRAPRCPLGRPLLAGEGNAIDYIDFFRLGNTSYDEAPVPVRASQLGPVIGHIRCSLTAHEDFRRGAPPIVNGTASFLPAGAAVYRLRGYPPACRLAAYLFGHLHVYVARAGTAAQRAGARSAARCGQGMPARTG